MFIVSANYRDRSSPKRWLVRRKDEPVEAAKEVEAVIAIGVRIVPSNAKETGFGCRVVAEAQNVEIVEKSPEVSKEATRLFFDGQNFRIYRDRSDEYEKRAGNKFRSLQLNEDGCIYAVI